MTNGTSIPTQPRSSYRRIGRRQPVLYAGIAVTTVLLAMFGNALITNKSFQWDVAGRNLLNPDVLAGVLLTLFMTAVCMTIGVVLGTVLALMRLSESRFLQGFSTLYTWVFRSVPQLVQLILWYNLGALYQSISLGVPFGPSLVTFDTNDLISPITAAILGLGLAQAAYTAEVVRSGILSVGRGQHEAARSLGMAERQVFRRVIAPQALRVIIPPVGNEVISMLKNTSLLSVLALPELFYSVQLIYSRTYETIPLLMTACIWYLFLVSLLSLGQHFIENHFGKGVATSRG